MRLPVTLAFFFLVSFALTAQESPPATEPGKPYIETIAGTKVAFAMIPIAAGQFTLGSPEAEPMRHANEGPQREVKVAGFWLSKCETTWDAYDLFWKEESLPEAGKPPAPQFPADAVTRPTPPYADETFGHGRDGHPCLGMTHHAAMMYCRWLSKKTGRAYRLPTEAEWEYACRAGSKTAYSFGSGADALGEHAWYKSNSDDTTHPIGAKKANAWGLHDMHGNVAEWCLDHFTDKDYANWPGAQPLDRPLRVPSDVKFAHVVRGGSWVDSADKCRSAARRGSDKSWFRQDPQRPQSIWWMTDADFVGFRVVRAVDEQPELKNLLPRVNWKSPDTKP